MEIHPSKISFYFFLMKKHDGRIPSHYFEFEIENCMIRWMPLTRTRSNGFHLMKKFEALSLTSSLNTGGINEQGRDFFDSIYLMI